MHRSATRSALMRGLSRSGHSWVLAASVWVLAAPTFCATAEVGVFDSAGKLVAIIHDGARIPIAAGFVVRFEGGPEIQIQPHDQSAPITRDGNALSWKGTTTLPNAAAIDFEVSWSEAPGGLHFVGKLHFGGGRRPLVIESADYLIDLPRELFAGGLLKPGSEKPGAAPVSRPAALEAIGRPGIVFAGNTTGSGFTDARQNWKVDLALDEPRKLLITDRWDEAGRSYRLRIPVLKGLWQPGSSAGISLDVKIEGTAAAAPAQLRVEADKPLYPFDGFGGNYCWGTDPLVTGYLLEQLNLAWSRHELKATAWDRERAKPGTMLSEDFQRIQRIHNKGVPWIISVWRVPERFYTDPNTRPPGSFGRKIAGERWDELLELFGSYLHYLKKNYGAEPDLFSFNEPDLGVDIGFSPEAHRDMTRRIGAYLRREGFKTRMLLGDTANPRDSHRYVLATAADPEAMKYVGALSFHSWNNGSAEQYAAWHDVARWLQLPLLVAEQGLDPGSWRNRNYDSFDYGLRELEQIQHLLRHAQPQSSLYWQYTQDYGLVRVAADGKVEPTGRFWLMKQMVNLTPFDSRGVAGASDQPDVLVSAFRSARQTVVHVLNMGPARKAVLTGLPGKVEAWLTTETQGMQREAGVDPTSLTLQPRSLTTLVSTAAAQ